MIVQGRDYEHTIAMPTNGDGWRYEPVQLGSIVKAVLQGGALDAGEFSIAGFAILRDRGVTPFTALPIFPARFFFHSAVWVRKDSPIRSFADLKGKRIALRDYTSTASIWFRGDLKATHGVHWADLTWVVGPNRRFPPPAEARIEVDDGDPEDLLVAGKVDACFMTKTRDQALPQGQNRLRGLLDDPGKAEAAYYQATGLYPLLHAIIVSDAAAKADQDAGRTLFDLFSKAKRSALQRKLGSTMVPWGEIHWEETMRRFGGDPLPYGLTPANRRTIDTLLGYLEDQRLISRKPDIESLFWPGSAGWTEERSA